MGRYNTQDDFWKQVKKETPTQCWEWMGSRVKDGYGQFAMNKQWMHTHRWSMLFEGHNIKGQVVMHSCDNPCCVNPAHLSLGTQQDNIKDMHAKGRYVKRQSKLSVADFEDIKNSNSTGVALAKKYNISTCYVSNIRKLK